MEFTYIGPLDEVEIRVPVRRGESVDVPRDSGLLDQPENWRAAREDLESLTVKQLEHRAEVDGVDLTGISLKADIITAIEKGA